MTTTVLAAIIFVLSQTTTAPANPPLRFIFNMIHDNPGEKPFETKYRSPAFLKALGYNGQVMKTFPQASLTYDAFDPEIVPKGSPEARLGGRTRQDRGQADRGSQSGRHADL